MLLASLFLVAVLALATVAAVAFVVATRRADHQHTLSTERAVAERAENLAATHESVQAAVDAAVTRAVTEARLHASAERDAAVSAALQQAATLQREQFDATMKRQEAQLASTTSQ
ncbi:MAG: hypothetical protein ABJ314_02665, partial [Ilumatobacter sp.]